MSQQIYIIRVFIILTRNNLLSLNKQDSWPLWHALIWQTSSTRLIKLSWHLHKLDTSRLSNLRYWCVQIVNLSKFVVNLYLSRQSYTHHDRRGSCGDRYCQLAKVSVNSRNASKVLCDRLLLVSDRVYSGVRQIWPYLNAGREVMAEPLYLSRSDVVLTLMILRLMSDRWWRFGFE